MTTVRVINLAVVGLRQYDDYAHFEEALLKHIQAIEEAGGEIRKILAVDDCGVAAMVEDFCAKHGKLVQIVAVDWATVGSSAMFQANSTLIERSSHVLGFWDRAEVYSSDAIDKGLRSRKFVKIFKIAATPKKYYSSRQKKAFEKVPKNEQASVCETVSPGSE